MRRFLFENGLSLFFGALFLASLGAQSLAGRRTYNQEQLQPASRYLQVSRGGSERCIFQPMRELRAIHDAEVERDQVFVLRYRARRRRRYAGSTFERLVAPEILAMLSEPDLADLEEVTPPLRVIQGGRS